MCVCYAILLTPLLKQEISGGIIKVYIRILKNDSHYVLPPERKKLKQLKNQLTNWPTVNLPCIADNCTKEETL